MLTFRRENPAYGKAKIAVILKRDRGQSLSESTVGRVLTYLREKDLPRTSASALRTRRRRDFTKGRAKPRTFKKHEDIAAGERVRTDHMSVAVDGITVKSFQAWSPAPSISTAAAGSWRTSSVPVKNPASDSSACRRAVRKYIPEMFQIIG